MAGKDVRTLSDYKKETNEETREESVAQKPSINYSFQVQNYRDYDVYSDVENVLNLNPVSYIDYVSRSHVEADTKTIDVKESQERPPASLTTNFDKVQFPPIASFLNTAAHIIAPAQPTKPVASFRRSPRRDDSDKNYHETVALNDEVINLFGDKKASNSVSKNVFIEIPLIMCLLINTINIYKKIT